MKDTSAQGHKLLERTRQQRLAAMLQSMSRKYPRTRLVTRSDGFGALLGDDDSLHITLNGRWSQERTREFLVLFAMWCDVDYDRLTATQHGGPHGALSREVEGLLSSSGEQD
jgi:hypothetical protein